MNTFSGLDRYFVKQDTECFFLLLFSFLGSGIQQLYRRFYVSLCIDEHPNRSTLTGVQINNNPLRSIVDTSTAPPYPPLV
jgi:hypothetical protein